MEGDSRHQNMKQPHKVVDGRKNVSGSAVLNVIAIKISKAKKRRKNKEVVDIRE